ncbi:MAG: hypothetical protein DWQ35_15940 [Planctomycetota bacterium]|nr:MAG: hypothetical protein DWQ35_15940 [Planctomycetota bacterium]REK18277.1 MAG: hypothetical protein DWQ42_20575 [Planctomycetota bacterium]REK49147.1 MAG: hypothetical protein DWQ46_01175 [Planctomycetota bacterium]
MLDRVRANSPISGSEFGVALAALIFLRWADFEEAEREAIAAFDDVDYEPVLPAKFHWRSWCNIHDPRELEYPFRELPSALDRFSNSRHDAMATQLHRVAPAVEKLTRLPADTLAHLIHWLADQPFETPKDRRALRDVLDFVLQNTYDKFAGQFFTPIQIAALMVELAKPKSGESVYDPCFGSAGLLTAALEIAEHRDHVRLGGSTYAPGKQPLHLAGVEINQDAYVIGMTRLVLSGVNDPQIELGNSLERLPSNNPNSDGFDIVLANPPWGMKVELYGLDHYPIPIKDSSSLFLQHAISQLRPGGRGVVVVPPSLLFRSGREQQLREWLLHENTVEAVVSIPRGAFSPHTSIETCLLLFRRGGTTRSVRMVSAESIFEKSDKSQIAAAPFVLAAQLGHHVRSPEPGREWWDVDIEELAELDYDLTPKRRDRSGLELILDSLPKEAEIRLLKDCCTVTTGRNIRSSDLTQSPPRSNYEPSGQTLFPDVEQSEINPQRPFEFADTPIPYIRIRDVEKGHATRGSSWLMPAVASTIESKWKLRAGDILLSKSGTIGKAGLVRNGAVGAIAANGFFVIRVKEGTIDPHYLLAYLQSTEANAWLEDRARGTAAKHLSVASIKELPIALPPLQIQQRTADQHRKFGVDALTYLAELLTEDESDSLAAELNDWVSQNLKRVESYEGDPASQNVLELLEEVADSRCPINTCKDCKHPYYLDYSTNYIEPPTDYAKGIESHCLECWLGLEPRADHVDCFEDETPIGPWAVEFRGVTKPLAGVSSIPDPTALVSVLQRVASQLRDTAALIDGNLPNQERARLLTGRVASLINRYTQALLEDAKLAVDVISATEDHFGGIDIRLEIQNRGRVPLRDVRFSMYPPMDEVEPRAVAFMQPGHRYEIQFQGQSQRLSDEISVAEMWSDPAWTISWTARDLAGEAVEGTRDLSISLGSDETCLENEQESAGNLDSSPYVCGDPVTRERHDVFFGRDDLLNQIKRQVSQTGNVVLLEGNRRAGKSSVLWHLEGANGVPGWLGVYCSLQGTEGDSSGGIPTAEVFRGVAYEIVQSIRKLNGSAVLPDGTLLDGERRLGIARSLRQGISDESPFQDFREYLELILETLAERQLGLLLMLDEFDKLQEGIDKGITSPQVPENIRFLVQSYPRFSAILTGSRRLKRMREEYWSALFGLGTRLGVSALPFEAASRLVTEPVAGRLSFSKSAVSRAYELTAGQPYLLQCLCNRVFDIAARTGVRSITVDHVNDAADALVEDNEHFASLWDYTEFDRRRFLLYLLHREENGPDPMRLGVIEAKLEEAGVELREEIVIADLEYLRELELVDLHGESSGAWYSLTIPMMGQWLDSQQDYEVLRSRARAEAEDISGKLGEIAGLRGEIEELEDSMDSEDD